MKKIVFAVIFTLFAFVGYTQQYVMTSKGYTVNGQVIKGSGYATLRVYLPDGNERLDSTVLDNKGRFVFRGNATETMPALLTLNGKKQYRIYLEPSLQMTMKIEKKTDKPKFKDAVETLRWYSIVDPQDNEDYDVYLARLENWVVNNPEDIFTCDIIASYLSYYWSFDEMDRHLNTLKGKATSGYFYKHLRNRDKSLEKISQGKKAPQIALTDVNNKKVSLNSFIRSRNYVLIDFWASWSKDYMEQLQDEKVIYERYKNKGFDIYAVSLDNNKTLWKNIIKDNNIPWTNVCDFQMWQSQPVKDYMIKSLPDNVLVDNAGRIIARNIYKEELSDKLFELLDNESYNISGNVEGIKEGIIKLTLLKKDGEKEVIESRINNGDFHFSGKVDRICMAMISLPVKDGDISFFMGNDNIKISGKRKSLDDVDIEGSPSQDEFSRIANSCNREKNPMQCLSNYVLENPSSIYSPFILSNYLYPYMAENDMQKAVNSLRGEATTMFQYSLLKEQLSENDKDITEYQKTKIRDFSLENEKGEMVSLYSYIKNTKYTLISFWASWDNNSRRKNIDYLRLYKNNKKNNFNILSVSLDDNKYAWQEAIKADGINKWENLSDLKRWNSAVVKLYNIKYLPSNILVDKEGNIIGKDVQIDEILNIISR